MSKKKMKPLDLVAIILLIVGGLNWGLIGLFNLNLVSAIFGVNIFEKIIYIIVGIASVYSLKIFKQ